MADFHSNRDAAQNLITGLKKLGECDFTSLTPTDITTTGATVVDGFTFDVNSISASTTIKLDSNGLYLSGGTGATDLDMNLSDFDSTFNGRELQLVGFSAEIDEQASDCTEYFIGFGTAWSDLICVRRSSSNTYQWQRRRGGSALFTGKTVNNGVTSVAMTANAGGTGRWRTGALTGVALDPILDHGNIGTMGPGDQSGWWAFPDGGGIFKLYWDQSGSRTLRIKRLSLWALREAT